MERYSALPMFAADTQTTSGSLQRVAVDSVKRRGFYDVYPPVADNVASMTNYLHTLVFVGEQGRTLRESFDNPAFHINTPDASPLMRNPLLMAQMLRLAEEVGELAAAILAGDIDNARVENADGAIVRFQIAEVLGCDLDTVIRAKLVADEQRGRLHGGTS